MNNIDVCAAKSLLDKNAAILIDVREPHEYEAGHIEGAMLLPLGNIKASDLPNSKLPIILYCKRGIRSQKALKKIVNEDNQQQLFSLIGGVKAWSKGGYEIYVNHSDCVDYKGNDAGRRVANRNLNTILRAKLAYGLVSIILILIVIYLAARLV